MDFPRSCRHTQASIWGAFKHIGTNATQMAVEWSPIVKRFDVIKNIGPGQVSSFVNTLSDTLFFLKNWRMTQPLPCSSNWHEDSYPAAVELHHKTVYRHLCRLTALIWMNNHFLCGCALSYRHHHCMQVQLFGDHSFHRPTNDLKRVQIQCNRLTLSSEQQGAGFTNFWVARKLGQIQIQSLILLKSMSTLFFNK